MIAIKTFLIKGEFITLSQFLKEESFISSGGQAKYYLATKPVLLNGKNETRRGKKIRPGDKLTVAGKKYSFRTEL